MSRRRNSVRVIGTAAAALAGTGCAGVLGWGAASASAQVVIDFNGVPGTHNLLVGPYAEDGYTLTSTTAGQTAEINGFQPNGLLLRGTTAMPQVLRLMNATNDPFDLLSIAVGDNSLAGATRLSGSNGASRLIIDSDLGLVVSFGAPWQNLAWVDITLMSTPIGAPGQLTADNLTVRTVPGPSGAILVAGALAACRRRRRTG